MKLHINVGLQIDKLGKNSRHNSDEAMIERGNFALRELARIGMIPRYGFKTSNTELTLVAEVECDRFRSFETNVLLSISELLQQDCIAVFNPDNGVGALLGEHAEAWGEFNPEYFISPNELPLVWQGVVNA